MRNTRRFRVGDTVEGGQSGTQDYDTGRVTRIKGDQVTVAWSCLQITTQHVDALTLVRRAT
jgi:hypothetical protein